MRPSLCSRCKKNYAVIFITKIENGETKNEGLCLKCAKELGIKPVDDMMKKLGITDEDAITRMMLSDEKGYNAGRIDYRADHGWLTLDVPAHSGVLLSSGALV